MSTLCHGSNRLVIGLAHTNTEAPCPICGHVVPLEGGFVPVHHRRRCLIPECDRFQTGDGLCEGHNRDVVEPDPLGDVEVP